MSVLNNIKAVLFDMDGTLVDTEPIGPETMRIFFDRNGINISTDEWNFFDKVWRRDGTKITFEEFVAGIFKKYLNIFDVDEHLSNFFHEYEHNILFAKPLAGACEILAYLKNKYKLALVTASSTSQARFILKNNNWENIFDIVISHDDFAKSKPDPECFLVAAQQLGVLPEACVVVEDSKNGALAGRNADMFVIGVRAGNTSEQDLSVCDMIGLTLHDVQKIFFCSVFGA